MVARSLPKALGLSLALGAACARAPALSLGAALGVAALATPAAAQGPDFKAPPLPAGVKTTYVPLAPGVPGVLYEPATPGPKSDTAFFVMHASGDYLTFSACYELSKRGYKVLCVNNTTSKSGEFDEGILDDVLLQAKKAVSFLRDLPDVKHVLLFGHSGGATIMTAYQAIAEQGVAFCQRASMIHKCPDNLAGMPAADGLVMADSNWGQAAMVLFSVDPAVVSETSGTRINPALDMYNPANGFTPSGTTYSQAFIRKFLAAEGARNNALIAFAQKRAALIDAGKGDYLDDEPMIIPGAFVAANRLFSQDKRLLSHSVKPWPLVHKNGTATTQIITSVRVPNPWNATSDPTAFYTRGALKTTVKNFLSSYAIRVTPDYGYGEDSTIHGVDWHSTYAAPPGNVEGITKPLLSLGMTGNWEGLAAETIFAHAASADKSLAFIEGATHMYTPCTKCETTPGQFGDTVQTLYNYIDNWVSKPGRFTPAGS